MSKYKVWDEFSESRENARFVADEYDPEDAALTYAKEDVDGNTDGVYTDGTSGVSIDDPIRTSELATKGHRICVEDEAGVVRVYAVGVIEYEPVYGAVEVKP